VTHTPKEGSAFDVMEIRKGLIGGIVLVYSAISGMSKEGYNQEFYFMSREQSRASKAISARMEQVEPGTPRYQALESARRFKTSWVELGSRLFDVRNKKMFEGWGFPSFESYCQDEIRIKPQTAAKLTASYAFLKKEEPAVLKRDGVKRAIPDLPVVELMRKARQNEELQEESYHRIKEMALDETPLTTLRKEYRESLPPVPPKPPKVLMKKLLVQAGRLAEHLDAVPGLPKIILNRAVELVGNLKALLDD
jgi:hypothetical protein